MAVVAALFYALASTSNIQAQTPASEGEPMRRAAIRFLTETDFPPFNYRDEDGALAGFNVDLAQAICLELSAVCDVQARAWAELLPALGKGQADAVIAGHTINSISLAVSDFTDSYMRTPARFAGRRGGVALTVTPDGLAKKRIGVAKGTAQEAYLRMFFLDSVILSFEGPDLARDALLASSVDLIFDDGIGLSLWLNGTLSRECCEMKGGAFYEPRFFGDGIAIAIPKGDLELRNQLNRALFLVQQSGRMEELLLRHFPIRPY